MLPPLLRLLLDDPALLVGHASGYVQLVQHEGAGLTKRLKRRFAWGLALLILAVLALGFGGVAVMLSVVTGVTHWTLWLVPGIPFVGALIAATALAASSAPVSQFPRSRAQLDKDLELFGLKDTE